MNEDVKIIPQNFEVTIKFVVQAYSMWELWQKINETRIFHPIRFIDIKHIERQVTMHAHNTNSTPVG